MTPVLPDQSAAHRVGPERSRFFLSGLLFLLLLAPLVSGCDLVREDDTLSLQRTPYTGDQLKIDGYYYNRFDDLYGSVYFFYQDGSLLSAGGSFSSVAEMDAYVVEEFIEDDRYANRKTLWGVFEVEADTIRFERWYPGQGPQKAYVREGVVLNDTTFRIDESYRVVDGRRTEVRSREEVYFFRAFHPKPDSTNRFVP